jgi:hypothetical protein
MTKLYLSSFLSTIISKTERFCGGCSGRSAAVHYREPSIRNGHQLPQDFTILKHDMGLLHYFLEFMDVDSLINFALSCRLFFAECFRNRTRLEFSSNSIQTISQHQLKQLVLHCNNLNYLDLSNISRLISNNLLLLVHYGHLSALILDNYSRIETKTLLSIIPKCGKLEYLSLVRCFVGVNNYVLDCIGTYCTKLSYLNISGCHRIMDSAFKNEDRGIVPLVAKYGCLKQLYVTVKYGVRKGHVTKAGIERLYLFCKDANRHDLTITFCSEVI